MGPNNLKAQQSDSESEVAQSWSPSVGHHK